MVSKKLRHSLAVFALIGTSWSLIATSDDSGNTYDSFHVQSDCVSPVLSTDVTVDGQSLTAPTGDDFTTLGFPTATVALGAQYVTGTINGVTRSCENTLQVDTNDLDVDGEHSYLYSCSDNGQFKCNIYLEVF